MWTRTWPSEKADVVPVLDELRKLGCPSAFFHLDRWHGLDREHQVRDQPFALCDVVFSPNDSPKWEEDGFNHFWLPPGVYGPECEPVPPNPRRWPYDVVFVGSHPYPHPEWAKYRSDLLAAFSRAFGRRFGVLPRRGVPIRGRDLQELYATVPVVLGDSCLAGESTMYWSDRVPETLGRGGLLIHPVVSGMWAWYQMNRIVRPTDLLGYELGDFAMAVELAKAALFEREEAQMIRDTGRATVLARDTYAHRMGTVLAVAEGIHGGYRETRNDPPSHVIAKAKAIWERASPEVEREAGVSFSAKVDPIRNLLRAGQIVGLDPREMTATALAEAAIPTPTIVTHRPILARHGRWTARFDPRPDEIGQGEKIVVKEVWETNDYRVPPGGYSGTVVDIGANIGALSVLASRAGAKRVIAFEPDESNYARLTHHIEINRASRVTAQRVAVTGGESSHVRMVGLSDGAHSEPCDADDAGAVPTITLAEIIAQYGPIEFIKIDAEGAEFQIFEAVPVELLSQVRTMALEWHAPVVTHLMHLRGDEFGPLVTKLADAGRVETFGHPGRGGLIWWRGYGG
jgi:FkbM family methyltransferase